MSFKDGNCRILLLILLFCILLVTVSAIFHQFLLVFYLVQIYWIILILLFGIPLIHAGIKEIREARQNGEHIPWQQNTNIIKGLGLGLPPLLEVTHLGSGYHPGNSHWPILDLIWTISMSVFTVPLLFLEIILTVGFIRNRLNRANPYAQYLQNLSTEEQSFEE